MNETDFAEIFKLCVKHGLFSEEVEARASQIAAQVDFDVSPLEATMSAVLGILGQRNQIDKPHRDGRMTKEEFDAYAANRKSRFQRR